MLDVGYYNPTGTIVNDLLKIFNQYLTDKNPKTFDLQIENIANKFAHYKLFNEYFSAIKDLGDNLTTINAFFTKDARLFLDAFQFNVNPEKVQTNEFISLIEKKKFMKIFNDLSLMKKE